MKIITTKKNEDKETHKWYTIHQEMNIKEIATIMNTTATDYLYFMRQFHPWGTAGHKQEIKHQTDILTKTSEVPYRFAINKNMTHDTSTTNIGVGTIEKKYRTPAPTNQPNTYTLSRRWTLFEKSNCKKTRNRTRTPHQVAGSVKSETDTTTTIRTE